MAFQVLMPRKTLIGKDALKLAGKDIKELGSKALIVSGRIVERNGIVALVSGSVFGVNTLNVAHPSSHFSTLNTIDVSVSVGDLLIGIASGVLSEPHK